jgi:hypothetical protein
VLVIPKNKISIFLVAFLFIGGLGFVVEDAFGAATTFVAIHNSTTQTEIIFSQPINGTLNNQNWYVGLVMATHASNGTVPAGGAAGGNNYATTTDGFLNNTQRIVLTHAALNGTGQDAIADVRYIISGSLGVAGTNADIPAANLGNLGRGGYQNTVGAYNILANNTGATEVRDGIAPTIDKAVVLGPKTVEITFSEPVVNINGTASSFTLTGTDAVITTIDRTHNGTTTMLLGTQNPIDWRDTFTLDFTMENGPNVRFLTDSGNSPFHGNEGHNGTQYGGTYLGSAATYGIHQSGDDAKVSVGNNLLNFTGLAINNNALTSISSDTCFDCSAPTISNVQLSTPNSNPIDVSFDDAVHVTAELGDTITISVTYDDNKGAASLPFAGIYTNFVDSPEISNLYYKNNFDGLLQMSTSYYEWNVRGDDVAYDNDGAITWDVASSEVIADTQRATLTYTMTINDHFKSSQVWIDAADGSGNYIKTQLPISIGTAGEASLSFASNGNQKVTSFFNENILFSIVSQWSASSDNTANTAELSSVLGIENKALPEWTTSLATWAADDKIDIADMVIAVEYVINQ